MIKWLWLLAVSILSDIEGISMILIWHLGLAERIAMGILLVLQITLFFLICFLYIRKSYQNKEKDNLPLIENYEPEFRNDRYKYDK